MKILVLSDIHDHILKLQKVIDSAKSQVEAVICCGDYCAPFSAALLSSLNLPTYACLGNNDEDQIGLFKKGGSNFTWTNLSQELGEIELDKRKVAFCHYPKLAELLAKSGDYDAVFYGHTHVIRSETIGKSHGTTGKTLLLNPGSVCGIIGGKTAVASYAIYDTERNLAEVINLV